MKHLRITTAGLALAAAMSVGCSSRAFDGSASPATSANDAGTGNAGDDASIVSDPSPYDDAAAPDGAPDDETNMCAETPAGKVSLPSDDSEHGEAVEWWYWTGHLKSDDGRWFGFEEVFFKLAELGGEGQMAHVALTDIAGGKFLHTEGELVGAPVKVTDGFQLSMNGHTASGGGGHDVLHGAPQGAAFDLTLDAIKAPVLHYGNGYIEYPKVNGDYTFYYSRERMATAGTVTLDGQTFAVTGQTWFDHQWGKLETFVQQGWEWFAIQLDDERDLMLYWPLTNGVPGDASGTVSDGNCNITPVGASDITITSLGTWKSPHTGCTYPMGWHVLYRDLDLIVTPALEDQELSEPPVKYWEGAATVSGTVAGRAYVELNGFCH